MTQKPDRLLGTKEVARLLHMHHGTLRELCVAQESGEISGEVPAWVQRGRNRLWKQSTVDAFIGALPEQGMTRKVRTFISCHHAR